MYFKLNLKMISPGNFEFQQNRGRKGQGNPIRTKTVTGEEWKGRNNESWIKSHIVESKRKKTTHTPKIRDKRQGMVTVGRTRTGSQ